MGGDHRAQLPEKGAQAAPAPISAYEDLTNQIRASIAADAQNQLVSFLALISFKLATNQIADSATNMIEDPATRIYEARKIKERIRQKVLDEWAAASRARITHTFRETLDVISAPNPSAKQRAIDALDKNTDHVISLVLAWARTAMDMTPTPDELGSQFKQD